MSTLPYRLSQAGHLCRLEDHISNFINLQTARGMIRRDNGAISVTYYQMAGLPDTLAGTNRNLLFSEYTSCDTHSLGIVSFVHDKCNENFGTSIFTPEVQHQIFPVHIKIKRQAIRSSNMILCMYLGYSLDFFIII